MYTDEKLLAATVDYNKFAHSQHLLGNKTFASSAINEHKRNQMVAKLNDDDDTRKFRNTALDTRISAH